MNGEPDILMLAESPPSPALEQADGRIARVAEPYDALLEMGRRRWSAVVLTAPRADFAGLCRASRRLQPQAALYGLCPPAAEPAVLPLAGSVLTDYFLCPPTQRDVERILRSARQEPASPPAQAAALGTDWVSRLVESAASIAGLERCIAQLLGELAGAEVRWVDAQEVAGQGRPLLLAACEPPRALVAREGGKLLGPQACELIDALQRCLPALVAAAQRTETLHRLAITDSLTGAYNRRYFYHLTDQILQRAAARRCRVTLLLYDIDDFKRYNENYGYAGGDEILRETAQLMKRTTRQHDVVARIGGDEFAVLFWDLQAPRQPDSQPPDSAYILAERFRRAVNGHEFGALGPQAVGALTISGGLAGFPHDGTTCRELLRSANRALKQAKLSGKNAIKLVGAE